jgi:formylglycine-generating enzyme required for sulfatase activity
VIEGPDIAASCISWDDATHFCERLTAFEGRRYRLPTEAEWKWACRAGTDTGLQFRRRPGSLVSTQWNAQNIEGHSKSHGAASGPENCECFWPL